MSLTLLLAFVILAISAHLAVMATVASATRFRITTWRTVGHSQFKWTVGPLVVLLIFAPAGWLAAVAYYRSIRPKLLAAEPRIRPATF